MNDLFNYLANMTMTDEQFIWSLIGVLFTSACIFGYKLISEYESGMKDINDYLNALGDYGDSGYVPEDTKS